MGISVSNPTAQLDISGSIKLGSTAVACNLAAEGQQKYNLTTKQMEFCNGSIWGPLGSVSSDIRSQLFTANGTLTVPKGVTKVYVNIVGGGAGGPGNNTGGGAPVGASVGEPGEKGMVFVQW